MMNVRLTCVLASLVLPVSASAQGFMTSPLAYPQGVYTPGIITTVLDHSLKRNSSGFYQYGRLGDGGGDGVIVAFNGETANGKPLKSDDRCVGGSILLKSTPTASASTALVNTKGCGTGYVSYDEHPGYDYVAPSGTSVMAAAAGTVVSITTDKKIGPEYCFKSNISGSCASWGYVGIDHGNGYISQYGHLSKIFVIPGQKGIKQGQVIGLSGNTAPVAIGPHLHFEVLKVVNGQYLVVDPYGWTGLANKDPLYSASQASPVKLWK